MFGLIYCGFQGMIFAKSFLKILNYVLSTRYTKPALAKNSNYFKRSRTNKTRFVKGNRTNDLIFSLDCILDNTSQFHSGISGGNIVQRITESASQ
jgi:hypothetical protein